MKNEGKILLILGIMLIAAFAAFTLLIMAADVKGIGPNGSRVGLATFNGMLHRLTGVNMALYTGTDWLGFMPIFILALAYLGLRS